MARCPSPGAAGCRAGQESFPTPRASACGPTKRPRPGCCPSAPVTAPPALRHRRVLARHRINLQLAKITTLGERVEDTFLDRRPGAAAEQDQLPSRASCWTRCRCRLSWPAGLPSRSHRHAQPLQNAGCASPRPGVRQVPILRPWLAGGWLARPLAAPLVSAGAGLVMAPFGALLLAVAYTVSGRCQAPSPAFCCWRPSWPRGSCLSRDRSLLPVGLHGLAGLAPA